MPALPCSYCIAGDGCMMEGLSNEACSLAGHWGLGKLILFYDDNKISIDGASIVFYVWMSGYGCWSSSPCCHQYPNGLVRDELVGLQRDARRTCHKDHLMCR